MASNPMQRKARVSFLMGMFITLLITGAIIALLVMMLLKGKQEDAKEKEAEVSVYVLNTDVKSGQTVTEDMCTQKAVNKSMVPANAIGQSDVFSKLSLQDKEGNPIKASSGQNGEIKLTISFGNGDTRELTPVEGTDNYTYKNGNSDVLVEPLEVPLIAKVDIKTNTVITSDLVAQGNSELEKSAREEEYNMIVLPSDLTTNDYVDIRLMLPSGQDFLVVTKKQVTIPGEEQGTPVADTIKMTLNEAEIKTMSNAIVDAYQILGSKLYAVKYTDGGIQEAITADYMPGGGTVEMISKNPDIVDRAKSELAERQQHGANDYRANIINPAIQNSSTDGQENLTTKMQESATKSQETRQTYLEGLAGE